MFGKSCATECLWSPRDIIEVYRLTNSHGIWRDGEIRGEEGETENT